MSTETTFKTDVNHQLSTARVTCLETEWHGFAEGTSSSLLPFLNRPFIHHLVDALVERGVRKIEFVSDESLDKYQESLGTGERWGAEFQFCLRESSAKVPHQKKADVSLAAHSLPFSSTASFSQDVLRVDSADHYLAFQHAIMSDDMSRMLTVERHLGDDVWVGRDVSIHSTARLRGPLLIGEHSRISAGVVLGPNTVIGPNCLIDRKSMVIGSTVFPNVYLGEGLDFLDSIINQRQIFNVRLNTSLNVDDDLILASFPW